MDSSFLGSIIKFYLLNGYKHCLVFKFIGVIIEESWLLLIILFSSLIFDDELFNLSLINSWFNKLIVFDYYDDIIETLFYDSKGLTIGFNLVDELISGKINLFPIYFRDNGAWTSLSLDDFDLTSLALLIYFVNKYDVEGWSIYSCKLDFNSLLFLKLFTFLGLSFYILDNLSSSIFSYLLFYFSSFWKYSSLITVFFNLNCFDDFLFAFILLFDLFVWTEAIDSSINFEFFWV